MKGSIVYNRGYVLVLFLNYLNGRNFPNDIKVNKEIDAKFQTLKSTIRGIN